MLRILMLIWMSLALALPAQAKPKEDKPETSEQRLVAEQQVKFSAAERNMIRSHLMTDRRKATGPSHSQLPPGLQKKIARGKDLPPGWQKKVAPGEQLDYSVYRQSESLPDELLRRLPPPRLGTEILRVEDKIMIINSATRAIFDVFDLTLAK